MYDPDAPTIELPPVHLKVRPGAARWAAGTMRRRVLTRRLAAGSRTLWDARTVRQRIAVGVGGGLVALKVGGQQPGLLAAAAAGYAVAAWRAGRPRPRTEAEQRQVIADFIRGVIGDRRAVHLPELYARFRAEDSTLAGQSDAQLRAVLDALRIPVRRQVRSGETTGRPGVHRDDLAPLPSPTPTEDPSPSEEAGHEVVGEAEVWL